ncbi:MAG: AMP-binding protein [Mariprofundaceae bacterium]|nr:AMP-binding protein [Mariprofundaceae bacterium]
MINESSRVLAAIAAHAQQTPHKLALEDGAGCGLVYAQMISEISRVGDELHAYSPAAIGIFMDNTPAWAVVDLAAVQAEIPCVPIPLFFSPAQVAHLINSAGIALLLTDQAQAMESLFAGVGVSCESAAQIQIAGQTVSLFQLKPFQSKSTVAEKIPVGIAKITFTSGTTGDPKGVCLTQQTMETVAVSLRDACAADDEERHLCALPLATLLENIGGIYVPLLAGGTCILPGLAAVGMRGSSGLDAQRFLEALICFRASTCILIPQMLLALCAAVQQSGEKPQTLRYLAVGGAPVSLAQLEQAAVLGLPVFEGYGLSEAGSVVAVNAPDALRAGTVGKPLAHVRLDVADDGEIMVAGALFSGYLGQKTPALVGDYYATGDIGHLDEDGFLHITGRKKHIFITAFGRNVSPEWVERELTIQPGIAQAVVFGEARPFNVAVLTVRDGIDAAVVEQCVAAANDGLPDYARVSRWILTDAPFSVANGLFTGTGRPRREAILQIYGEQIKSIYEE